MADYPIKGRGGQGVINIRVGGRNGLAIGIRLCQDGDDVMFVTEGGMIVRSPVASMRAMGRGTQGVRVVNLKDGDRLVATEIVSGSDLAAYGVGDDPEDPEDPEDDGDDGDAPAAEEGSNGSPEADGDV